MMIHERKAPSVERKVNTDINENVSKMYIPKGCNGYVLGGEEWKGSDTFRKSIMAWMPKPEFKKGE